MPAADEVDRLQNAVLDEICTGITEAKRGAQEIEWRFAVLVVVSWLSKFGAAAKGKRALPEKTRAAVFTSTHVTVL